MLKEMGLCEQKPIQTKDVKGLFQIQHGQKPSEKPEFIIGLKST